MARGMLGLVRLGDVLDAGCGDGTIASLLSPRAKSVTLLDSSEKMIDAAKARLRGASNARFVVGDVEAMPLPDASFDAVLLFHVLTCAGAPERAIAEAARVLRPGGTAAILALDRHDHGELTAAYGHRHAGFRSKALGSMLEAAGLEIESCEVTSRERREPYFQVVSAFAHKRPSPSSRQRKKS
jgi:ubiquinone/menaquinone biosynthesis C-methylase UbiE